MIKIPYLSEQKILKILQKRTFEDLSLIEDLEKDILRRRKWVVSPLVKGENIILLLSGGLDSIAIWGLLLKHYQVHVYPFHMARDFRFGEEKSIRYYSQQFHHLAGYHAPFHLRFRQSFFKFGRTLSAVDPQLIASYYVPKIYTFVNPLVGSNFFAAMYAAYYRMHLWWEHDIKVNKIISGVTATDGVEIHTQSHTFLRQLMLMMMSMTRSDDLEYFSLGLEKKLGLFLHKTDYVKLTSQLKIDLTHTHSCDKNRWFHCGKCTSCRYRQILFNQLNK